MNAVKIAAVFEIDIQDIGRQGIFIAGLEIHQQEGEIVDGVDPAKRFVELNAVKHRDLIFKPGDVGQMKITMTLPHKSAFTAGGNGVLMALEGAFRPALQRIQLWQQAVVIE